MSPDSQVDDHALKEAWGWLERLESRSISAVALKEFFDWREAPGNDAAYRKAERIHRQSGAAAKSGIVESTLAEIDARASARQAKQRTPSLARLVAGPATVAAVALAFYAALLMQSERTYQTAIGERKTVALPDGSSVTLDTGSKLRVQFSNDARTVALIRGQALFDVVHRAAQPFKVSVGSTMITDLGTRFDVRKDARAVKVTVISGSAEVVTVGATSPSWILHKGQEVSTGTSATPPHPVDTTAAASWIGGHLVFDDTSLSSAVEEVNRYGKTKIVLAEPNLGGLRVSGTFDTGDAAGFAAGVAKLHSLAIEHGADGSITLTRADARRST